MADRNFTRIASAAAILWTTATQLDR